MKKTIKTVQIITAVYHKQLKCIFTINPENCVCLSYEKVTDKCDVVSAV